MEGQRQQLVEGIEEIKERLFSLERSLLSSEKPTKADIRAIKEGMKDYRKGRTIAFTRQP